MVGKWMRVAAALPLALMVWSTTAEAQLNPFRGTDLTVSEADIKLMNEAALPLYTTEPPVVGATASWQGKDGNYGTIEMTEAFEWKGLPCRKLQHIIKVNGVKDPLRITIDRCKTADGEWKIRY